MKVKMASAPIPGLTMGSTILTKVRASLAPSMRAASSISVGMPSLNCFIRNTPNGQPTMGKMTAQMVLYRFSALISRSRGIRMTCLGSAIAQTMRVNSSLRPTKRFLASA